MHFPKTFRQTEKAMPHTPLSRDMRHCLIKITFFNSYVCRMRVKTGNPSGTGYGSTHREAPIFSMLLRATAMYSLIIGLFLNDSGAWSTISSSSGVSIG